MSGADHRARLRALLDAPGAAIVPGAPDALTARLVEQAGFPAVYLSGAGFANVELGVPDVGLVSLTEIAEQTERIREAVDIPLVVDADTGFGGPLNVHRTVKLLERRGASALQLEDQVFPKRCGHFEGKEVVSAADMVARLHAAVDARTDENLIIIGRTDARATDGLDEAIERALRYKEAGADVLFVEAPRDRAEIERVARELPGPLLLNIVEGGRTPMIPADELGALGYSLVLYANAAMRGAMRGAQLVLASLREHGESRHVLDAMIGWSERQTLVNKPAYDALEQRYRVSPDASPDVSPDVTPDGARPEASHAL
ncbi:2,3-dimethylmalate lyase [Frankia canadensis]|uniref:2-methylisocitrate lyase n=1 Tax=Frankia canadensis TaxID=1836972 RepID=A0A2I2KRT2_9ACTN|nr:oxaloacetate decarboxylase [Frankia canadensis]SNQ48362.1 2,3-dimethylmalate lyase [Frankia canadensis]SOU55652.1 2,3-dimethylmalate lyase [Frankia canadensis]